MAKNIPLIYKILTPSGKVYIGQTWNLKQRLYKYQTCHTKMQPRLHNSLIKYGWGKHSIEILCELPKDIEQDMLNIYEQTYIDCFKLAGFILLNTRGAGSKGKLSEDSKKKVRESLKKYYENPENRIKVSNKLREYYSSEENRKKHSASFKNRRHTEESKKKLSISNKAFGARVWLNKSKKCIINGIYYESGKNASINLNIPYPTLIRRLNSRSEIFKNYQYV